jgi:N-acetylmuramoyl-L-alanine amidase
MTYLIAVDNGHGLETPGKRTPALPEQYFHKNKGSVIHEKEFNRPTADFLIIALKRCGFKTLDVSPGLKDVSLKSRYDAANKAKANAFISIHYNASKGVWGDANGIETIVSQHASEGSLALALLVQTQLIKATGRKDRGVKTDIIQSGKNLAVLRNTTMPAILTESGFMDNLKEAKTMLDPVFQKQIAEAMCKGICDYFSVDYKDESIKKVPTAPITPKSSNNDIKWLQESLNAAKLGVNIPVTGKYCPMTRIGVLIFWETKKWKRDMKEHGLSVATGTIDALDKM